MVACVVVCVCGVLIGQPPTVPPADSGKGQAAAAAPAAGLEGPWKVGEARCYRVSDKTTVMPNTPDRGQEDSGSAALIECLLRFTPVELGPFEQRFALAVMEVKGDLPTPLGRAVFNTGGAGGGDKLSRAMEVAASRVLQTKMVVTVKGGHVASITGNEALDDPSAPGAEVMALLGGDRALLDRCRWCLSLERGAAEGAEGSWRTSFDLDYRELYGVFLPARLAREKTEGGVTVYALSPAGKPAARQKADRERAAHGRSISAQVGDGLAEGRLRWSDADGRLESGSLTVGCTAERNVDGVRSADRQERTLTFMRGPAPEAGTGVRGGPPVPPPPPPDWEGPWAVGKSKDYRVTTEAVEVLTSPDNPGHRTQKRSTDVLTVRIVPVSLEGGRREFRVTPLSLSLEVPTPFGRVALDTAGAPPGDEMSSALYSELRPIMAMPLTVTVAEGGGVTVTGNERIEREHDFVRQFYGRRAAAARLVPCVSIGAEGELKAGRIVSGGIDHDFLGLFRVTVPTTSTVESVEGGVATVRTVRSAEQATVEQSKAAEEALGKSVQRVTACDASGVLRWHVGDRRLLSAACEWSCTVEFAVGGMKGIRRLTQKQRIEPVAPAAGGAPPDEGRGKVKG